MRMKATEKLGHYLTFGYLNNAVQSRRTHLNRIAKMYAKDAMDFFQDVVQGLRLRINAQTEESRSIENLSEIIEASGGTWKNAFKEDLECMIIKFKSGINYLKVWLKNPQKSYEESPKETEELSTLCNKLRGLYIEKYQVF